MELEKFQERFFGKEEGGWAEEICPWTLTNARNLEWATGPNVLCSLQLEPELPLVLMQSDHFAALAAAFRTNELGLTREEKTGGFLKSEYI